MNPDLKLVILAIRANLETIRLLFVQHRMSGPPKEMERAYIEFEFFQRTQNENLIRILGMLAEGQEVQPLQLANQILRDSNTALEYIKVTFAKMGIAA